MKIHLKYHLLLLWMFISTSVFAQQSGYIVYAYEDYGGFEMKTKLYFDGAESWYVRLKEGATFKNEKGWEFYHYKDYLYTFLNTAQQHLQVLRQKHNTPWLTAADTCNFQWYIQDEAKTIAGYQVQRAQGKALIRDSILPYGDAIAWFATELPFFTGPEGYAGLPGLILQLEYEKRGLKFTAVEVYLGEIEKPELPNEKAVEVAVDELFNTYLLDKKWLKREARSLKKN